VDNERRADLGIAAVRAAASITNVWRMETAETSITDVLAYIAHACDRLGLGPEGMFEAGLRSYEGDFEDGPAARVLFDGAQLTFADMKVWGE
jgi:hypothetical protein